MSEPTLAITRTTLRRYLGRMLPVSRDSSDWTGTDIEDDVADYIASGERGFYYHTMVLPGESTVHQWSFLRQQLRLMISDGHWQYDLPDDFGGFVDSELSYASDDFAGENVRLVDMATILDKRAMYPVETSTHPIIAAEVVLAPTSGRGQRTALAVWPTPTADRTLYANYLFNPNGISSTTPYPFGGQQHAETLIESCLSAAELHHNDEEGSHTIKFQRLLAASILRDRALTTTKHFGYNGNDNYRDRRVRHEARDVTYEPS